MHPVVYGPIPSVRFGKALVVDPYPSLDEDAPETPKSTLKKKGAKATAQDKPNSILIVRGSKPPSGGVVVTSAARRIIELSKGGDKIETILVHGTEDPALHPGLREIAENLRDLRDKWFSKAKLTVISGSLNLDDADTRHAISIFDRPVLRFDWGSAKSFASLTGEPQTKLKSVIQNLRSIERFILRATFQRGEGDNTTPTEVRGWLKKIEEVRPTEIEVTTVDGNPRSKKGPKPAPDSFLKEIVETLQERTDIPTRVAEVA